ncbi:nuclear transport factor 2 family protein [Sphingomonas sabuli]|uniref:Nuclear transport factor 2 family protein n=1 Tax=Sphingomonas sabuli TaxID=2764186 RepID=A0A7G9L285_9SPHN|nr:nuclear transport factor 2 family protein [Sphingomonas sabuli]QNM82734.1 nuclear transport factor 2 family protein [Sphingomonas sabuli]
MIGYAIALALAALPATPNPQADDKVAINTALNKVYGAISGPVGAPRDWDAMRAMFTPDARLYAAGKDGKLGGGTVQDYIDRSGKLLIESGFTETALVNRIEAYGDVAQVWSSYEGRFTADGKPKSVRGINSFQLHRQATGEWKVHSILWQSEHADLPLPPDMVAPK